MARSSRWKDASGSTSGAPDPAATFPPGVTSPNPAGSGVPPVGAPPMPGAPIAPSVAPQAAAQYAAPQANGEVAELRSTLADLQATVASLVERTVSAPVPGATPETDQASRIIVMANRAAESTIEDARGEAEGIVAAAKAQSFEIIRMARELANQELAAERERVAQATQAWLVRRHEVAGELRGLEQTLLGYRSGLDVTSESLRAAVATLESDATALPVIDALPAPDPSAFVSSDFPAEPVIDLTTPAEAGTEAPTEPAAETAFDDAQRTNLFGGPLPPEAAPAPPAWPAPDVVDAVEVVEVDETPSPNLRPGLFGR